MTMFPRFREWLLAPVRTPARAALAAAVVIVSLTFAGWYGLRTFRYQREEAAARAALTQYDFPQALRHLETCLQLRPREPALLLLATQAARRDGRLDTAQDYLDRYEALVGRSTPPGALQSVLIRVQRGLVKEYVFTLLKDYVDIRHPDTEQILEALAVGCVHVYRLDEASFFTKQLLERYPDNVVGRLIDAQTTESLRRREQAFEKAQKLVEDHPHFDKARLFLAGLHFQAHRYEEAIEQYQRLHQRQPAEVMPLLGLVRSLLTLDRIDEARPLLRELEEKHADHTDALLECARFALRQKRPADAEPLLRRAVSLSPHDHEAHYELAVCLEQLGRTEEAQRHLERSQQVQADMKELEKLFEAMVKSPADPAPRLEAGRICLRNGQAVEGVRWLLGVLELAPHHRTAHQLLADYYESAGDALQARYHRSRAR